jgi:hypothetical protein
MSIQNRGYFESSKGTVILSNQRVSGATFKLNIKAINQQI